MNKFTMCAQVPNDGLPVEAKYVEICADALVEALAPVYLCRPISADQVLPLNKSCSWGLDHCICSELVCNPIAGARLSQQVQNIGNLLSISRYLRGSERGIVGPQVMDRRPGPIYMTDQAHTVRSVTSRIHIQKIFVPKSYVDLDVDGSIVEIEIGNTYPSGRLLHATMDQLFELLRRDPASIDQAVWERFIALLKIAVGVHPEREDVRAIYQQSLYEEIISFIEGGLGDPHLSAAAILRSFGVSRASLYRMFEPYGGVRSYIMQRRVVRAVMELNDSKNERGDARRVAETWGFSSQPNFNRMIKKVYGNSPARLFERDKGFLEPPANMDPRLANLAARSAIAA